MRIYFDEDTGQLLYTISGSGDNTMPPGEYIEVEDDVEVPDMGAFKVIDGELVHVPLTPEEAIAEERLTMVCSPLQGSLALGETLWDQVELLLNDPETPFAIRRSITSASVWERNSQSMDELAWLMGLSAEQVDDLFRIAMTINT